MTSINKSGFTIIESMLFLAITALVFVVGFAGIGSRLEAVRYTDSVRNLESDVETVLRNTDDGLNLRLLNQACSITGASPVIAETASDNPVGQQEQCAVAGVDVNFEIDETKRDSFTTNSTAIATGQYSGGDFEFFTPRQINDSNFDIVPYIVNASEVPGTFETYDLLWGLEYRGYYDNAGGIENSDISIRYIRSPISTQTYVFENSSGSLSPVGLPVNICFIDTNDRSATLTISSNAKVSVAYQNGTCDV
jgi:type II secretory pathway pseudopilin PulG